MKRKIILSILFCLMVSLFLLIYDYYGLLKSGKTAIKNLEILSTASGFVNLDIINHSKLKTIVCPNNILYDILRGTRRFFIHPYYFYKVGRSIEKDRPLKVSEVVFNQLDYYSVNLKFVKRFERVDLLNDTTYVKNGYVNYRLDWETQKVVIYTFLKQEFNCAKGCESGLITIVK